MASKTALAEAVKAFRVEAVEAALDQTPRLIEVRNERGRNWLHLCAMTPAKGPSKRARSIALADLLLGRRLGLDEPAFTEGPWRATPLWHAIAFGRNLALAEHLLKLGCDPNHCLFAAAWNRDVAAIDLLARHGAVIDEPGEGGTPFLGAVGWSRFDCAQALLRHGAAVDAQDEHGRTALHLMLRKGSDKAHFAQLLAHHPRGDIPDKDGQTALEIMRRKRDPDFRRMAAQLA